MDAKKASVENHSSERPIIAYGQANDPQQKALRYRRNDDTIRVSNDMTVMSVKLDQTAMTLKKRSNNPGSGLLKNSDVDDLGGRLDTEDGELDIGEIHNLHRVNQAKNNANDAEKKEAFGVSHNIFDVSSYGEVHLNMFQAGK